MIKTNPAHQPAPQQRVERGAVAAPQTGALPGVLTGKPVQPSPLESPGSLVYLATAPACEKSFLSRWSSGLSGAVVQG